MFMAKLFFLPCWKCIGLLRKCRTSVRSNLRTKAYIHTDTKVLGGPRAEPVSPLDTDQAASRCN